MEQEKMDLQEPSNTNRTGKEHLQELRSMSNEELLNHKQSLNRQIFEKRTQHAASKQGLMMERSHIFKKSKKEIARINTILRERKGL